ncbi:DUF6261 family protein [Riemerella anatipestifer]|uniref:Uncharacterized protein n=1 Tax=Riemerella anatipestifer RA-CH-1 TaxID=1228997 RepID=J9R089_RIEAN|nr:DUF6261 family protein [Riemerella anatipestifer]AFR35119.1 hypothetical protein B739_0515 [Riemerella anatipestifer RA-CH-1]AIH02137.1 hypothetical protein M949_0968 [Riemerella anatipestifer CH3]MCO7332190.1 DUF6261 family protein [Riemerella anatipestifer]MCO7350977.1 DUF6261 family protein [Riemerella anatipestifer]MCU7581852.1 DUF6261 family protein [Riemerella anatipestifer]
MKITLRKLNTKDLATLAQRVINSSTNGKYKIAESLPLLTELEEMYQIYDGAYTKLTFSGKGKAVAQADKERDEIYKNLKAFLVGYRRLALAPHSADADALYKVLEGFGIDIDRLSYSAETAQMKKLIEALDEKENKDRLGRLGISAVLDDMKAKQTTFETLFAEQAEANAELRQVASASSLRRDLEQRLKTYLDFVTIMKKRAEWSALYADLNELVKAAKNSTLATSAKPETPKN